MKQYRRLLAMSNTDVTTIHFQLPASDGELLSCTARFPTEPVRPLPALIFLHGFKGFKDWGGFPYACQRLADADFYVVSINFSHNGVEGNGTEFTQLERFANNTHTREIREACEVIDAVAGGDLPESHLLLKGRVGVIGHSRGGGTAIIAAAEQPSVAAVAVWGSVSTFDRYTPQQKQRWRDAGFIEIPNARTGQIMRMNASFLDDLATNQAQLDICAAAARLSSPLLVLHGEQDLSVKPDNGARIAASAPPDLTTYLPIPNTGHTFGTVHPFAGTTLAFEQAIDATEGFFLEHLLH
ncbi:MAG: alpha/beta fold hydrolase [Armatimonadetes bacterium]|nr:alpha/beta fold hydrolase [Armatimonadota bacterium]